MYVSIPGFIMPVYVAVLTIAIAAAVVVFAVIGLVLLIKLICNSSGGRKKTAAVNEVFTPIEEGADDELAAVITAAVAAYIGGSGGSVTADKLRITSIKRVTGTLPPWRNAGIYESVNSIL